MRRPRRVTQADYLAAGRGLARDCAEDVKRGLSPAYRFHLICPKCEKLSETVQEYRMPGPDVKCGECLMNHVDIVRLKVVKVEYLG